MRHDILELAAIPTERAALANVINEARHRRKIRRLKYWAALNLAAWAVIILLIYPSWHAGAAGPSGAVPSIYLPVVLSISVSEQQRIEVN